MRAINGFDAEVIVVDNNSSDASCSIVKAQFPSVILMENKDNKGFSKANNQAVAIAKGEYLLFLNPDTVMPEDFFKKTIPYLDEHPDVGALGPRLIDGKGLFAPDAKKSFPSLSVAIFKTTGLNKIFPHSTYINKYYAVHVQELQTASVEVLSGCCMLVRHSLLSTIGKAFDEDYFMYCEDVDLSFRIQNAGFKNIYFPEATLIHYKGESTRKASLSYIRVFNEALSTFVRKHYTKANATLFILLINIGIGFRALWSFLKVFFKFFKTPIFDALAMLAILILMNNIWVEGVRNLKPIDSTTLYATFPVYILLWILSVYLNGGYDQPYRALRVIRGMIIGTIIILAYFGVLSAEYRYSRAVILFSGALGALTLVILHELLNWLGIAKIVRYNRVPKRAVIVASEEHFKTTGQILDRVHYAPDIIGRIGIAQNDDSNVLASVFEMKPVLQALNINEIVFCVNGLTYETILAQMQYCGSTFDYKIHLPGSNSFVGSNSSNSSGDLYTADKRYNIATFIAQRNKRVFDIVASISFLFLSPILFFYVKHKVKMFSNIFLVLIGRNTWVGYTADEILPKIKPSVLPTYTIQEGYTPVSSVSHLSALSYAEHYVVGIDFAVVLKNLKFIGRK